jgi:ribosome-associated protein
MQSKRLCQLAVDALEDLKAVDIVRLDVRKLSDFTDYMIIASGRSSRQVAALAENVVTKAKQAGEAPLGVEGREFYQLEKLWSSRDIVDEQSPRGAAS